MANEFDIIEKEIGPVIEIEERVPVSVCRLFLDVTLQNAEVVGMPYARYQEMDWDVELNRGKLSIFFSLFTKKWHFFVGMLTVLDNNRYFG